MWPDIRRHDRGKRWSGEWWPLAMATSTARPWTHAGDLGMEDKDEGKGEEWPRVRSRVPGAFLSSARSPVAARVEHPRHGDGDARHAQERER